MTDAEAWRKSVARDLSATDLLVKAAAMTLHEYPRLNARLDGDGGMVEQGSVNIGLAVGLEDGLLVPVLSGAEGKSLPRLADERRRAVESALSADHRLADGMLAARFLQAFKEKLETVLVIQGWMES